MQRVDPGEDEIVPLLLVGPNRLRIDAEIAYGDPGGLAGLMNPVDGTSDLWIGNLAHLAHACREVVRAEHDAVEPVDLQPSVRCRPRAGSGRPSEK